jgi:Ca-activated chloride channel family protein
VSFAAPWFLLGLVLVPLAGWWYLREQARRRRAAAAFVRPVLRPAVVTWQPGWRRHVPSVLFLLALTALLGALARPQATVAVPVERATVVLVTDHSTSMRATDVQPNRLTAARAAAGAFLDGVPGRVRVGAVAFSHHVSLIQSPTSEHSAVRDALDTLRPEGATATRDALEFALQVIRRENRRGARRPPAAIVLLSDGRPTRGGDPVIPARRARALRVPIHTVSLGTPEGVVRLRDPATGARRTVPVPPDSAGLERIARASGGRSYSVEDARELDQVYRGLATHVATRDRLREVTWVAVAGALLLVLAGGLTSMRWFARPA